MHGKEKINPVNNAGNTKHADYVNIIPINPNFVSPTRRMIPISCVFVSTEIISKEYIRSTATIINITKTMSKIRPMNNMLFSDIYILCRRYSL